MASPGAYVIEQDDRAVDCLNEAICLLEMRCLTWTALAGFFLDFIEYERRHHFKLPAAMLGYLVSKIERSKARCRGGDNMRIWNWNDSCGLIVVTKDVGGKCPRYPIYKFVHVRLIVFPVNSTDHAMKVAVNGVALERLYHFRCAVVFWAPLDIGVRQVGADADEFKTAQLR